uniref:RAPGEFL1 n=1 Tax=Pantodon buchholzi TaxID=8276 RepID=A0A088FNT8_PANBU|nr:RAPGEFL1 [Pantodon buchholzi]
MPVEVKPLEKFVRKPPSACDTDTDSPSHLSAIHFTRDSPGSRVCLTAELIESVTGARRASSAGSVFVCHGASRTLSRTVGGCAETPALDKYLAESHRYSAHFILISILPAYTREDAEKDKKKKPVRPLFRHFRRSDACLQPCKAFRGSDENHSYVTIRSRLSCRVAEILALVQEKLQYNEEQQSPKGSLRLVSVTSSGEKSVFRLSDEAVFTALGVNTHLFACEAVELEALLPLPDEISWSPNDSKLHDMSAEEVAAQLLSFHWELFSCIHEVEFVGYVFHGDKACWRPLNLELVLQRCSEVQHWVATEILQCQSLPKRVQLLRKFIKIACLGVVDCGGNRSTWRTPCSNTGRTHKLHTHGAQQERARTADPRADLDMDTSVSHLQTKAYVRQLQVIDNQNLLFIKSCKLEPGEP